MILPISQSLKYKNMGDCKLVLFSHLLSYYNIEVSPSDIIVAAAGLDFDLFQYQMGAQYCFFISGRRLHMEDEFANLIGLNLQKKRYAFHEEKMQNQVMEQCKQDIIELLNRGNPIYLMLDRYYLSYIHMNQSHMPYHAMLVIGYDLKAKEVYAIDSLKDDVVELSFDILLKAMFETSIIKSKAYAEIQYIDANNVGILNQYSMVQGLRKQKELFFSEDGALENMNAVANFLEMLMKKVEKEENKNFLNFLKYQVTLLYTEMHDQDYGHMFYRSLYFERVKLYLAEINLAKESIIQVENMIDQMLDRWKKLIQTRQYGQKFEKSQVIILIEGLRFICSKEKEIFEVLNEMIK